MADSKKKVSLINSKEFDRQYAEAKKRGEYHLQTTPRAETAYYDARRKRIVVELSNGCVFMFPPELAQGLANASAKELAEVRVMPSGFAIGWDKLDVHFSLTGLLAGEFGNKEWMAQRKRSIA
jgi:hypothetical protein